MVRAAAGSRSALRFAGDPRDAIVMERADPRPPPGKRIWLPSGRAGPAYFAPVSQRKSWHRGDDRSRQTAPLRDERVTSLEPKFARLLGPTRRGLMPGCSPLHASSRYGSCGIGMPHRRAAATVLLIGSRRATFHLVRAGSPLFFGYIVSAANAGSSHGSRFVVGPRGSSNFRRGALRRSKLRLKRRNLLPSKHLGNIGGPHRVETAGRLIALIHGSASCSSCDQSVWSPIRRCVTSCCCKFPRGMLAKAIRLGGSHRLDLFQY